MARIQGKPTNCWIVHFRLFWSIRFVKRVASIPSHEIFVSSCFLVPGVGMGKNKQSASSLIRGPLLYDGTEIKTFLGLKSVLPSRERALLPILLFQPWSDMITMAPFTYKVHTIEIHKLDLSMPDSTTALAGEANRELTRVFFNCRRSGPIYVFLRY